MAAYLHALRSHWWLELCRYLTEFSLMALGFNPRTSSQKRVVSRSDTGIFRAPCPCSLPSAALRFDISKWRSFVSQAVAGHAGICSAFEFLHELIREALFGFGVCRISGEI